MIEKVNPAHPDKIADRIAGALVDYAYSVQSNHRIAVEVLVGHRVCHIIAETSAHIPATFVQDTVTRIAGEGVVMDYCEVTDMSRIATNEMTQVPIERLIPYINNARTHSPEQIKKLRASLREFGFVNPVLIDRDYNVIAGHVLVSLST